MRKWIELKIVGTIEVEDDSTDLSEFTNEELARRIKMGYREIHTDPTGANKES